MGRTEPAGEHRLWLVPHDPAWAAEAQTEAARVREAIGGLLVGLEHVGSTAVPGLLAKPVLDLAAAVRAEADADVAVAPLRALGYAYRGAHGDDPARRYYVLDREGRRAVQLHLWVLPARGWDEHLRFRDLLCTRLDLAVEYAEEKLRVAEAVGWDKRAYALAKGPFIERLLRGGGG